MRIDRAGSWMILRLIGFRVVALSALGLTSSLLSDDVRPAPSFCPFETGCALVTTSQFGRPLGIPLEAIGLLAFLGFFALTLLPNARTAQLLGAFAIGAGIAGLLLVAVQLLILKQTCRLCLLVNAAGIFLAAIHLGFPACVDMIGSRRPHRGPWILAAILAIVAPPVWSRLHPPPLVPEEVKQAWVAGKVNIVEITDFTCSHCRQIHEVLEELRRSAGAGIHYVRFVAASANNQFARNAAKAYACAVRQGAGDGMAGALFAAESYSQHHLQQLARQVGLDLARFNVDWNDSAIDREIESTRQWVERQSRIGLPQLWVNDIHLLGEQTPETLRAAVSWARSFDTGESALSE